MEPYEDKEKHEADNGLSALNLVLMAANALCFGGCIVLLALTTVTGPLVLLTVGAGLMLTGKLMAAIRTSRQCERTRG